MKTMSSKTIDLFHTSPRKIEKINNNGRFGSFLFFAAAPYVMTASEHVFTYKITIEKNQIIRANMLFYDENAALANNIVKSLADRLGINESLAESLIDESKNIFSVYEECESILPEDLAEISWDIQYLTAQTAAALGYKGVAVTDEQGTAWMIDATTSKLMLLEK